MWDYLGNRYDIAYDQPSGISWNVRAGAAQFSIHVTNEPDILKLYQRFTSMKPSVKDLVKTGGDDLFALMIDEAPFLEANPQASPTRLLHRRAALAEWVDGCVARFYNEPTL